jgi:hypothetical protein
MMRRLAFVALLAVLVVTSLVLLAPSARSATALQTAATPAATPTPSLAAMPAAGVALTNMAQAMDDGASALDAEAARSGDQQMADLAGHWREDAQTLRAMGVQLLVTTNASGMVHDPDAAYELDLEGLRANGELMLFDGKAMVAHANEMEQQIASLRGSGALPKALSDQLAATTDQLKKTGEQLERDGQGMRDYADQMLRSIGR